jgi:putative flippase GtrA
MNITIKKKDWILIVVIGAAIGLLAQPILANNLHREIGLFGRIAIFLVFAALAPLALWIASLIDKAWRGIYQFAQFAAVGTLNSFIDIGIFNLETFFYGSAVGTALFALFKAVSFLCATTNSFFWNRAWTFGAHRKNGAKETISFYVVAGLGWILNVGVATLVKALGPAGSVPGAGTWTNLVAPLAGVAASFLWDFFGYKYFVFKK